MTAAPYGRQEWARTAAAAARQVSGVAFLRPRLAGRLRSATSAASTSSPLARQESDPAAGVRVRPGTPWKVEIQIMVRRGHCALDVTRAVRAAVAASFGDTPVHVTVTVSGIV